MDFVEKFRERVGTLRDYFIDSNFKACGNLSTDLIRSSEFASYSEGIFIGEFLESLFDNIRMLNSRFDVSDKDSEKIKTIVIPVIEYIQANIPLSNVEKKAIFFDLLLKARCTVTETIIEYYRAKKMSKPSIPPMPFPTSVEIESDEEE
jgi:hypothetical protein